MYEYVFIALTNSEIRNVLCSISFNKTSDESLASNHDNTSGRESEGKLFLTDSHYVVMRNLLLSYRSVDNKFELSDIQPSFPSFPPNSSRSAGATRVPINSIARMI